MRTNIERRLRRSRPEGPTRDEPLSKRARMEYEALTGQTLPAPLVLREPRTRIRRNLVMLGAAIVAVVACGVMVMRLIGQPINAPIAKPESEVTASVDSAMYRSIDDLARASDLVVHVRVIDKDSATARTQVSSRVEVLTTLEGTRRTGEILQVSQHRGIGSSALPLEEIGADSLVLFLQAGEEDGKYTLTNSRQSVITVDEQRLSSLYDELDLSSYRGLDQLISHFKQMDTRVP